MFKQKKQPNSGFTLLELLIYVTILAILIVVIANTFVTLSKGSGQSQARGEVDSAIRFAAEILKQDIKNASAITSPSSGSGSALTLVRGGETIVYDISGGALRRKFGAGAPENLTNANISVSSPTFTRIENTNTVFNVTDVAIKINMTFSYAGNSPDFTYSASLQATDGLY